MNESRGSSPLLAPGGGPASEGSPASAIAPVPATQPASPAPPEGTAPRAGVGASTASPFPAVPVTRTELLTWLTETDPSRLAELWRLADETRRATTGDEVHLRGLIEISNHCVRQCAYCGLRAGNHSLPRYRMSADEILSCARTARDLDYGTVVLQSGEDWGITTQWLSALVRRIKAETGLAVTLSLGERREEELLAWREAGADRYLLRFETSDTALYQRIHPPRHGASGDSRGASDSRTALGDRGAPGSRSAPDSRSASGDGGVSGDGGAPGNGGAPTDRIALLRRAAEFGYEVGSGIMVGLPGQTYDSLVDDLELFRTLDLDMIGIGPYIPPPATPLADGAWAAAMLPSSQVQNDEVTACKVLALARLVCPEANIPSTTALATIDKGSGRRLGLQRGANVIMPDLTPTRYRVLYEVYPGKAGVDDTPERDRAQIERLLASLGRRAGTGPGGRRRSAQVPVA